MNLTCSVVALHILDGVFCFIFTLYSFFFSSHLSLCQDREVNARAPRAPRVRQERPIRNEADDNESSSVSNVVFIGNIPFTASWQDGKFAIEILVYYRIYHISC